MAFRSLHDFVIELERQGELIRIKELVNPELEITEIVDRFSKQSDGGKALLFENTGTDFPVLINLFGSTRRMALSLGVNSVDDISKDIDALFKTLTNPKESFLDKLKLLPSLGKMAAWMPKTKSGKGSCQEVVNLNPDITKLPILKCWPCDGGRFVTLPMVNTKDPDTGIRNVGMYRMQLFGPKETGMHWHKHKTGARHYEGYKRQGKLMPIAVALGGDPVYTYSATAPLPDNLDEYILAGFLRKKRVSLVRCITVDLEVPEDVDFVIEGYIDPNEELVWEGPFGDHTGFYSLADWYPQFHITCITHRKNAIYPATIVGVPPMEDAYIAKATERIFLSPMKISILPELEDLNLPIEGVAHNISVARIKNSYTGNAFKVMNALWGAGQMMFNKILIAVDGETNIHDPFQLAKVLSANVNPSIDIFFDKGPLDVLDHASDVPSFGSKMFIDATSKNLSNQKFKVFPDSESIAEDFSPLPMGVYSFDTSLLSAGISLIIISVDKKIAPNIKDLMIRLFRMRSLNFLKAIIVVDKELDIRNIPRVIWYASGNFEPQRDTYLISNISDSDAHVVFDGTRKVYAADKPLREWPNVVMMDSDTIERINRKWNNLGLGKFIASPSVDLKPLMLGSGPVIKV